MIQVEDVESDRHAKFPLLAGYILKHSLETKLASALAEAQSAEVGESTQHLPAGCPSLLEFGEGLLRQLL